MVLVVNSFQHAGNRDGLFMGGNCFKKKTRKTPHEIKTARARLQALNRELIRERKRR